MMNKKGIILLLGLCCMMLNSVLALPDLVAEIDYYPKNATVGDNVTVVQTIKNIGEINLTHVGILYTTASGKFVSAISYPPSGINLSANSEINYTFNFIVKYGKFTVETIADYYNTVDETNETNNNATFIFDFPVIVNTDKKEYKIGEPVNISSIGNNGSGSVYVLRSRGNFVVFKFENRSWKNLITVPNFFAWYGAGFPPSCKNGTVKQVGCCVEYVSIWGCNNIKVNSSWIWDQKYWSYANLTCGNQTYNRWIHIPVEPGQYKIRLYFSAYNDGSCSNVYTETSNFTITDSSILVNPDSTAVFPSTNFTIQINISGNNIYGAQFDLYFNATILEAINVTEENFLKQNCTTTYSTSIINNTIGKIKFADTCTGETGVNGSGVLCNITFKAKSEGSSALNFDSVKVLDSELQQLYVAFTDGTVNVDSALPADANNDHVVDIFDLATVGKAFGSICGDSKYDPKADINKDCEIDIFDLAFVGKNFGKSW